VSKSEIAQIQEQARQVFVAAGRLGAAFWEESRSRASFYDASAWDRHAPVFEEMWNLLLGLREAMQVPPVGLEQVVEQLNDVARIAKRMRLAISPKQDPASWIGRPMGVAFGLTNPGPPQFTSYHEFFPDLNTISERGLAALHCHSPSMDDPFAFLEEERERVDEDFTLTDRYPNTAEGHVRFLEFVYLEIREQADALRAGKYTHASIEKQLREGVKWSEAKRRAQELSELPAKLAQGLASVMNRTLDLGTVAQIEELFRPIVRALRDSLEQQRSAQLVAALNAVRHELELWNSLNSPSESGYLVERVPKGHRLQVAMESLQVFFGGMLPRPAVGHWRKFLELTRADDKAAESEAEWLITWLDGELGKLRAAPKAPDFQMDEKTKVLENLLWPADACALALTAGFRGQSHDALVELLQTTLDKQLPDRPRLSVLQSLQDRGCDLLIEWQDGTKHGIQLKSNFDIEEEKFAATTIAQMQDSRQHGLAKLYVVFCGDLTSLSNLQKVRSILSRMSAMNDPYLLGVPPERAWPLLFPHS